MDEWNKFAGFATATSATGAQAQETNPQVLRKRKSRYNTKEAWSVKSRPRKRISFKKHRRVVTLPCAAAKCNSLNICGTVGNVAELVEQDSVSKGASWNTSAEYFSGDSINSFAAPNAWTGFRNVCYQQRVRYEIKN